MTTEIATLGVRVDASGIVTGATIGEREFNRLIAAADRTSFQVNATEKAFTRFSGSHMGLRKVENALSNIGLTVVGIQGPFQKLTEGLLLFGGGGELALGFAATLAIIGKGYELITEKARKAHEEQEKLTKSLLEAADARLKQESPGQGFAKDVASSVASRNAAVAMLAFAQRGTPTVVPNEAGGFDVIGRMVDSGKVAKATQELEDQNRAMHELAVKINEAFGGTQTQKNTEHFEAMRNGLRGELIGIKETDAAAAMYAVTLDTQLDGARKREIIGLIQTVAAMKAAKQQAEEFEAFWADIDRKANLAAPMTAKRLNDLIKARRETTNKDLNSQIFGAFDKAEAFNVKIERPEIFEKMEQDAKLFEETWKNAIRGTQEAFADFFDHIGQNGFKLVSLLDNIAKAIRRTLAEVAAQRVVNALLSGFGGGGGGSAIPGASSIGNIADNPIPKISPSTARGGPVMNQAVHFNIYAPDGPSVHQMLVAHAPTILGIVGQGVADSSRWLRR